MLWIVTCTLIRYNDTEMFLRERDKYVTQLSSCHFYFFALNTDGFYFHLLNGDRVRIPC